MNNFYNKAFDFIKTKDNGNPYHNYKHIKSVWGRVVKNPLFATLSSLQQEQLVLAAIFHDAGHSHKNTEDTNLSIAKDLFFTWISNNPSPLIGYYDEEDKEVVLELIEATNNQRLKFIKEDSLYLMRAILKDADITQTFQEDDYWRNCLFEELGIVCSKERDIEFINSIYLFTPYGLKIVEDFKEIVK